MESTMKPPSTEITDNKRLILAGMLAALVVATAASPATNLSTAGTGKRPNIVINLRLWN
jgi:hypothetical protein